MSPAYFFYNLLIHAAFPLAIPWLVSSRLSGSWPERFGIQLPAMDFKPGPRIWIHAVSVGEVQVAASLIQALNSRCQSNVWLSTSTKTGQKSAQNLLPHIPVMAFPLDVWGSPARGLEKLKPDLVIILETEFWPNFINSAKKFGAKIMLANGRISTRSIKRYQLTRTLWSEVVNHFDLMAMIRPEDRERIISIGADPRRVLVAGNAKYDLLLSKVDSDRRERLRNYLALSSDQPVFIAGSTRPGEEEIILTVFTKLVKDFPNLHLILAPRHVERVNEIKAMLQSRNLVWRKFSQAQAFPSSSITLLDVTGELFYLYGLASVAFCGASLVPLGGQNPFEPAAWSVPVLYGPSMEDFLDAREKLEQAGAGQRVDNAETLFQRVNEILSNQGLGRERGQAGYKVLLEHQGAAQKLADLALRLIN